MNTLELNNASGYIEDIASIFKSAYNSLATISTANSAFQHTCIWPFEHIRFLRTNFPQSERLKLYGLVLPSGTNANPPRPMSDIQPIERRFSPTTNPLAATNDAQSIEDDCSALITNPPTTSTTNIDDSSMNSPTTTDVVLPIIDHSSDRENGSLSSDIISPSNIIPRPKTFQYSTSKNKSQKSEILTGSPFKNELEFKSKYEDEINIRKELQAKLKKKEKELRLLQGTYPFNEVLILFR